MTSALISSTVQQIIWHFIYQLLSWILSGHWLCSMKGNVSEVMAFICLQEMFTNVSTVMIEWWWCACLCVCVCVRSSVQTESELGCPGGKARIIHKESDIITAFAINKVQLL